MEREPKKQQTVDTYNKSASSLAEKFDSIGARAENIDEAFSFITKANPKVLEIGCANGRDAKEILKHTSDYLGIDISEELIRIAKQNMPKAKFEVADIENYDFPQSVDTILAFASLIHSDKENLKAILDKVYSSLNEGGIIYISMKQGKYKKLTQEDKFGIRTYYYYTPEDIRDIVGKKFKILKEKMQDFNNQSWLNMILQKN